MEIRTLFFELGNYNKNYLLFFKKTMQFLYIQNFTYWSINFSDYYHLANRNKIFWLAWL